MSPLGGGRFSARFEEMGPFDGPVGTDTHAVEAGCVSVTPLTSTTAARG